MESTVVSFSLNPSEFPKLIDKKWEDLEELSLTPRLDDVFTLGLVFKNQKVAGEIEISMNGLDS
ncbi:hypothetical protein OVS_03625 [Mycoplasma ovis str. Michigan]|uniref:Uncharacterized protein n=1 Tax=Mycoplasma ovis str. Michigan TaxID=1415773 RepID=A0ABN4BRF4_9MOLU|nr:hypothetical protein [Mycoplasma ovis]AHC40473.1 hypothetical protein OVS_03625 [Mycoplasma ovis str. Michigan]